MKFQYPVYICSGLSCNGVLDSWDVDCFFDKDCPSFNDRKHSTAMIDMFYKFVGKQSMETSIQANGRCSNCPSALFYHTHQSSGYSSLILLTNTRVSSSHLLKCFPAMATRIFGNSAMRGPTGSMFSSATYRTLLSSTLELIVSAVKQTWNTYAYSA